MFHLITASLWCALIGAAPARAMRLSQPVFTREDCERALLSDGAAVVRRGIVDGLDWLAGQELVPVNFAEPRVRLEDIDPDFAEFKLGPDATVAELKAVRRAAAARRKTALQTDLAGPLAESTAFTPLQAAALGVTQPFAGRIDALTVKVGRTAPDVLTIETRRGETLIGSTELSLAPVELGYVGDIDYWTYHQLSLEDGGGVPPIGPRHFISDQGVAVLRPVGSASLAFVIRLADLDASGESVQIDVHTVRRCPAEVARTSPVHLPPFAAADGRGWCFTPTGLKLLTFEVSNP